MEHIHRIMYVGRKITNGKIVFMYSRINPDGQTGTDWTFKSKLFKKGTVGSIYPCTFTGSTVNYSAKVYPTNIVKDIDGENKGTFEVFPFLYKARENDRQVSIELAAAKVQPDWLTPEIDEIRRLYNNLSPRKRAAYIGNIIYRITK